MNSTQHADRQENRPSLGRRLVIGAAAVFGLVVLYLIGAAVIPRWWAQRVADVVDGRLTVGALYGLFIGLVFTVAPLLAGWAVIRWRTERRTWKGWLGWLALVALTATPNLMTLGTVTGRGNAARTGRLTLDTQGPGFRVWSVVGAIVGVIAFGAVMYLTRSRRASRRQASELRDELDTRRSRDG